MLAACTIRDIVLVTWLYNGLPLAVGACYFQHWADPSGYWADYWASVPGCHH
jgi:hypothetical protein